jgi:iron complex transport system permease protein
MSTRQRIILIVLAALLVLSMLVAVQAGAVHIPPGAFFSSIAASLGLSTGEHSDMQQAVLMVVRLPRVVVSLLAGAALATGGTAMQALFRNPLADPSIIGISSGAALMAAVAIVMTHWANAVFGGWASTLSLPIAAFIGAVGTTFLVFGIAREGRRTNVAAMLLAGVAIAALTGALTGLLTFTADDAQLRSIVFWMLGSLGGAGLNAVWVLLIAVPIPLIILLRMHKPLNALALGEDQARHIGVNAEAMKRMVVLCTALMVGATVALCGVIGFVGLVVPHMLRLAGGADNRFLLPASALGGAVLLCLADTLARTVAAPAEIPIGVITALCGAPVFLYLLVRRKRSLQFA